MLDQEYKKIFENIEPDGFLVSQTKTKMAEGAKGKLSYPKIIAWCGSAAAAAAVVCVSVVLLLKPGVPVDSGNVSIPPVQSAFADSSEQSQDSPSSSGPIKERDPSIPIWYEPGRLQVLSLLQKTYATGVSAAAGQVEIVPLGKDSMVTASPLTEVSGAEDIILPKGYESHYDGLVGDDFVRVNAVSDKLPHQHDGVFYHLTTKKIICCYEQAKNQLEEAGYLPKDAEFQLIICNPYNGSSVVTARQKGKNPVFYACSANGSIQKLDIASTSSSSVTPCQSSDYRYGAFAISRQDDSAYFKVWFADMSGDTVKIKEVSKMDGRDYKAGEELRFTPNDRYLVFNVSGSDGKLYRNNAREQWLAYDTEAGTAVKGGGKFLRYLQNGTAAVLDTPSGGKVMHLTTGEDLTKSSKLEKWEQTQLVAMRYYSEKHGDINALSLENVFDSKAKPITIKKETDAYLEQNGYVYTYLHHDKAVECYSIRTGERFSVPVSKKLLEETAAYDGEYWVRYTLSLNKEGTKLFLTYKTYERTTVNPDYAGNLTLAFQNADCLMDLAEFVKQYQGSFGSGTASSPGPALASNAANPMAALASGGALLASSAPTAPPVASGPTAPSASTQSPANTVSGSSPQPDGTQRVHLMLGNGFSALVIYHPTVQIDVIVEDYRDHTFTWYRQYNSLNNDFRIYDDGSLPNGFQARKPLSDKASQKATQNTYRTLQRVAPVWDYAAMYTNGKFDPQKMEQAMRDRILNRKMIASAAIGTRPYCAAECRYYESQNTDYVYKLLQTAYKHEKYVAKNSKDESRLSNGKNDLQYWVRCEVEFGSDEDVWLGRTTDKKPFINVFGDYYFLTEQEYQELRQICEKEAAEAKKNALTKWGS